MTCVFDSAHSGAGNAGSSACAAVGARTRVKATSRLTRTKTACVNRPPRLPKRDECCTAFPGCYLRIPGTILIVVEFVAGLQRLKIFVIGVVFAVVVIHVFGVVQFPRI